MQSQKRRRAKDRKRQEEPAVLSEPTAARASADRRTLLLAALLIAATVLVYLQACQFGFVLIDDPVYVSENPHVRGGLSLENAAWSFTTFRDGNWIPFTWLSLMLDTWLFGFHAGGYHATNVLLHVANTVLLFALLARATGNAIRSACVAALFALHPLHVESVAWITERKDVLSTLFGLLSLLTYVRYARSGGLWSLAACFACLVASLLAKQTLVTLPFVFLLLDFWPLGRVTGRWTWPRLIVEKVPLFFASAAFSAVAIVAQRRGHAVASLADFSLATRCLNAIVVYAEYLAKTVFPFHLAVFYPHPGEHSFLALAAGAALLLLAISAAAVVWLRRFPFLFVGWAWYLGTLVPMIGLVQVGRQQMADRYTYFPLIGLFVAVVWLCAELVPESVRRARLLAAGTLAILALFWAATFVQAGYWRDSITLFRHARDCDENNPVAASALGSTLLELGHTPEAISLLEKAVQLAPRDAESHFNLAVGLEKAGRLSAAEAEYKTALALDDWDPRAHTNLGRILWKGGQFEPAKRHFRRAIEIDGDHVSAYVNLAALCGQTGDFAGSIFYNQQALSLDPSLSICRYNIALALRAQGKLDQAIDEFEGLLKQSPEDADARRELARTREMQRTEMNGAAGSGP